VARAICDKLAGASAPVAVLLPNQGCNEWDRDGADLHDSDGLAAFCDEMRQSCPQSAQLHELDAHINDAAFIELALAIFDAWVADGTIVA